MGLDPALCHSSHSCLFRLEHSDRTGTDKQRRICGQNTGKMSNERDTPPSYRCTTHVRGSN